MLDLQSQNQVIDTAESEPAELARTIYSTSLDWQCKYPLSIMDHHRSRIQVSKCEWLHCKLSNSHDVEPSQCMCFLRGSEAAASQNSQVDLGLVHSEYAKRRWQKGHLGYSMNSMTFHIFQKWQTHVRMIVQMVETCWNSWTPTAKELQKCLCVLNVLAGQKLALLSAVFCQSCCKAPIAVLEMMFHYKRLQIWLCYLECLQFDKQRMPWRQEKQRTPWTECTPAGTGN